MRTLLERVAKDNPNLTFTEGDHFFWSPKKQQIVFANEDAEKFAVTLLHELAHAQLAHQTFTTDFELLLMEVAAWDKARELGAHYNVPITEEHIENCLDTYRDWLYMRSTCPTCTSTGIQTQKHYRCFNCQTTWRVSASQLCRPYRKVSKK